MIEFWKYLWAMSPISYFNLSFNLLMIIVSVIFTGAVWTALHIFLLLASAILVWSYYRDWKQLSVSA